MFKSNLLNKIVEGIEECNLCCYNLEEQRVALNGRYQPEVAKKKLQALIENNESSINRYFSEIKKAYESELAPLEKQYNDLLSGSSITEDVKLFNTPGLKLTTDEVQHIANRYKSSNNTLMLRVIGEYADKNELPVDYNFESTIEDKRKAINEAYEYGKNYSSNDFRFSFEAIKEGVFPTLDNRISGTN